ncbi:DUF4233 domain-containing protein [Pseudoclavibacter sp. RFBG4]|nr:DUF4233 domain-containing protein [Pseudoclavibacter sp. VKM Ac-2888]PPF76670.1 DUF4233 domain-containing protein [Pseudoclavibacter sp. Z016]PPG32463.1 DUF4233 domain-containing protein [Pseudoclavibacter sp. RFBG4]
MGAGVVSRRNSGRLPRQRSIREVIGSIFLGFELFVVFLGTLLVFGMRVLEPVPAFALGLTFAVLIVVTIGLLRYEWGIWLGWAVQILLVAAGFLHPGMFVVGALFLASWTYFMWKGGQIDRQRAPIIAEYNRRLAAGEIGVDGMPITEQNDPPSS